MSPERVRAESTVEATPEGLSSAKDKAWQLPSQGILLGWLVKPWAFVPRSPQRGTEISITKAV